MFCPQCRVEYRPGFTHCADCDVDLVSALPQDEKPTSSERPSGSLRTLWEGEDLALYESLLDALEAAGIGYFDQPLGIYPGVRRRDPFPIQPMARFGYQVAVLSSDLERARQILGRLLEEEPPDMELPAENEKDAETPTAAALPGEVLTCDVWSGSDETTTEFLEAALKENGIPARMERQGAGPTIYVSPSMEGKAREVVREIVEGAPPDAREQK